uniref:T9SS type A sorting domain-containing protein n=1 Tax=Rhodothermus marinus TaxID=29549 RepID=A0A7V2B0T4_RHOMR
MDAHGVEDEVKETPKTFVVYQNYPNPFHPRTAIRFDLPEAGDVRVEVFNLLGEKVATLYEGFMSAGVGKTLRWDAVGFPSGVYFYRVSLNSRYVEVKKMVLVK